MGKTAQQTKPGMTMAIESPGIDAQTRRLVEKSIVRINGLVAEAGQRNDAIADHVFETFYDGDVQRALNPNKDAPAAFSALLVETDGTLHLGRTQLFCAVRIGALNRRLAKTTWSSIGWTVRIELLRALGPDQSIDRVSEGATFAAKQKATVREVRVWIDEQLEQGTQPPEEKEEGGKTDGAKDEKATGPTFLAGRKAVELSAAIGKAADRRRWVGRFLKLSSDEQSAYRTAVKAAIRNLEKLSQELDAALDNA